MKAVAKITVNPINNAFAPAIRSKGLMKKFKSADLLFIAVYFFDNVV